VSGKVPCLATYLLLKREDDLPIRVQRVEESLPEAGEIDDWRV
jgi:hypothetical protein